MICTIAEFENLWKQESQNTQKILRQITDASLGQPAGSPTRTVGRMAWHIAATLPEMMSHVGLSVAGPKHDDPVPARAAAIVSAYDTAARSLLEQIKKNWTDATLKIEDDLYGERWTRSATLTALIIHEIHHRGQLTVLMRLAGLKVPGIYGPAREEWAAMGMPEPTV